MKRLSITLCLCAIAIIGMAQQFDELKLFPSSDYLEVTEQVNKFRTEIALQKHFELEERGGEKHRLSERIVEKWLTNPNGFRNSFKMTFTYDEEDKLEEYIGYSWSNSIEEWEVIFKVYNFYNEAGNLVKDQFFAENNNDFRLESEWLYTYDENQNRILFILNEFDYSTSSLKPYAKYFYGYDDQNRETLEREYAWADGGWENAVKKETIYNAAGYVNKRISSHWINERWKIILHGEYIINEAGESSFRLYSREIEQQDTLVLVPYLAYTYFWNEVGNIDYILGDKWDSEANEWNVNDSHTYRYNEDDKITQYLSQRNWNETTEEWEEARKRTYLYDSNGNEKSYRYTSMFSPGIWEAEELYDHIYNAAALAENVVEPGNYTPLSYTPNMNNQLVQQLYYENNGSGEFELDVKIILSYETLTSAADIFAATDIKVYPNPANEAITFQQNTASDAFVELFDMQGKRVANQRIQAQGTLPVQHLSKGMYIYKFTQKDKINTGKIMVQ